MYEPEQWCPCGGPPCQTPAGHGCGLRTVEPHDDDGCPKGDPDCLGNNGDCHDACSTFAERAAEARRCTSEGPEGCHE